MSKTDPKLLKARIRGKKKFSARWHPQKPLIVFYPDVEYPLHPACYDEKRFEIIVGSKTKTKGPASTTTAFANTHGLVEAALSPSPPPAPPKPEPVLRELSNTRASTKGKAKGKAKTPAGEADATATATATAEAGDT